MTSDQIILRPLLDHVVLGTARTSQFGAAVLIGVKYFCVTEDHFTGADKLFTALTAELFLLGRRNVGNFQI